MPFYIPNPLKLLSFGEKISCCFELRAVPPPFKRADSLTKLLLLLSRLFIFFLVVLPLVFPLFSLAVVNGEIRFLCV